MMESWHKIDPLASKQVEMDFLRDFGDTFMDFETAKSTVPDMSDTVTKFGCLSENIETHFDCDDLLSVLSPSEPADLGLELDTASLFDSVEPLRQDCMWSGLGPSEEHTILARKDRQNATWGKSRQMLLQENNLRIELNPVYRGGVNCEDVNPSISGVRVV